MDHDVVTMGIQSSEVDGDARSPRHLTVSTDGSSELRPRTVSNRSTSIGFTINAVLLRDSTIPE